VLPIDPASATATAPVAAAARAAPTSFAAALRTQATPMAHTAATSPAAPVASGPRAALASIEAARQRLDGVLAAARRGATFTPQELLALQADAYRYSQTVEVASRVVEHAAQTVKQAVNTNV
jgi:hypothetical protein